MTQNKTEHGRLWTRVCSIRDLPSRGGRAIRVGEEIEIALFRLSHGAVLAVENKCPHKGGKLSEGIVADHTVVCPLHGWRVDLLRGEAVDPDKGCVRKYPVDLGGEDVFVDLGARHKAVPSPLAGVVGRHPDSGRPKLGAKRAGAIDFSFQDLERDLPVLSVEPFSPHDETTHRLAVVGLDGTRLEYSVADLKARFETIETPTHVTCLMFGFTRPVTWTGIRLRDLVGATADPEAAGYNFASFFSWDTDATHEGERFFETLPRDYILDPRTVLAFGMNGGPLPKEHGGPLRLAIPFLQGYKSVKWLTEIRLTAEDEVGYKKKHGFIMFPEFEPPADFCP